MAENEHNILVVDDEVVICELLSDILAEEGYGIDAVTSGPAALELLEKHDEYIILFTDIMMPEMNGIELIREARKASPEIIPIVMTGYATLETARDAVREGAYDYVLKPFSLSEIKLAVSNALERYRLMNENARLRELSELFNISETIASIHDEKELLDFVLRAALDRVNAQRGSLMLTTPDGKALEVAASEGLPEEALREPVKLGAGISGWVAKNIQPLLVPDLGKNPEMAEMSQRLQDPSFISVPLERKASPDISGHRPSVPGPEVLAVLNVCEKKEGIQFTEGDLKTLSIVANHAAAAIDNVRLIRNIEEAHLDTLQSMALLLEVKDSYTHGHSQRVREYSKLAARKLGLSDKDISVLHLGAALHDVGKIGVTDGVLNKVERLTEDEWESIKRHPVIGHDVVARVRFLSPGHLTLVRNHHERIDGGGYPDGLSGDQLPISVRIISVADAYDAMTSSRAYRKALPAETVLKELEKGCGAQFDEKVAKLFIEMIRAGEIGPVA